MGDTGSEAPFPARAWLKAADVNRALPWRGRRSRLTAATLCPSALRGAGTVLSGQDGDEEIRFAEDGTSERGEYGLAHTQVRFSGVCSCDRQAVDARRRTRRLWAGRHICCHFFEGVFGGSVPASAAFTLPGVSPEPSAIGSHPGMPCKMRSAFFAGVMWP
jgi:hypothetical protein